MQAGQPGRQAFVVAHQPAEAGAPGEAALDHPAAREEGQQHAAARGFRSLDNCEVNALNGRILFGPRRCTG